MKVIATNELPTSHPAVTLTHPVATVVPPKPGPTLVKVSTTHLFPFSAFLWLLLSLTHVNTFSLHICFHQSKVSRKLPQRRVAVRRARSRSRGWKSSSTTSMFPQTRSRRPAKHLWTPHTPAYCSNSSCFSSCRSSASSSSITTTKLYYQHRSSTCAKQITNTNPPPPPPPTPHPCKH